MDTRRTVKTRIAIAAALGALLLGALLIGPAAAEAQNMDFCGCAGSPDSLGAFVSFDEATWPAGTVQRNDVFGGCQDAIEIPLPPDGVVVFDSIDVNRTTSRGCNAHVTFSRNAANTPVTVLVKGDVIVRSGGRITVSGFPGGRGTNGGAGQPGLGGVGGFAGGEGAYEIVNFANIGGNGVGPGGGLGGTVTPAAFAAGGVFVGVPELRPLLGGSGGGGGRSSASSAGNAAGGGGGGGGAVLIAANGTIDIQGGGFILADGGTGGDRDGAGTGGGGGSGGAIRLLANRIQGGGGIYARGGGGGGCCVSVLGNDGGAGRIRMEAIFNTFAADNTSPVAVRAPAPGPLVNPITPTVRIAGIDGAATPADPIGHRNQIDMLVDAPGIIQIDLATTDVPVGTDLEVKVKPRVGGAPVSQLVTLVAGRCVSGACSADADFDLPAGAYIVEARATFQTP
jgi:hypothetical protein